ncbi:IclR family transcriptional regulator [Frankia sp. AgKG'84/4]|uniref:IclR family transcriptional regulator n=1 Tax=Frankia sp. AgKG'84/4 TaxID=573490 RepID=UPI00200E18B9|nr:IclR family transcriptional regulator C-terminal domain-containing protein [Frankia sp. AgKG'84/4]MCL9796725.1 hypothetical protein [Frankia sp. AgKG'84/4]
MRDATGETAMLVLVQGGDLVAVATAESPHPIRMALAHLGFHLPYLGSSAGRAVLSRQPDAEVRRALGVDAPAAELTEIAEARRRGWARSLGDVFTDANTVAAPVVDSAGFPLGAMVVAAPAYRLTADQLDPVGELVRAAADVLGAPPIRRPG